MGQIYYVIDIKSRTIIKESNNDCKRRFELVFEIDLGLAFKFGVCIFVNVI